VIERLASTESKQEGPGLEATGGIAEEEVYEWVVLLTTRSSRSQHICKQSVMTPRSGGKQTSQY